ncbi:hypothetical protein EDD22DRAFT_482752 [Suillus occidentalis]|nr:hypothetical protein EDD22DRAFT_482752 [Suillus occidentalis]
MVALSCTMYAIMSIRVFAMYSRSRRMRIFLIICFLAASAFQIITDSLAPVLAVGSASQDYVFSGMGVCTTPMAPMVFFFDGILNLCIELLFLVLAARVLVKHTRMMREHAQIVEFGHGRSDSLAILWDHVLHFSCYLILSVMQVAAISTNGDTDGSRWYRSTVTFLVTIQQCVLVPRLVISTRRYFSRRDYVSDGAIHLGAMAFAYNRDVNTST